MAKKKVKGKKAKRSKKVSAKKIKAKKISKKATAKKITKKVTKAKIAAKKPVSGKANLIVTYDPNHAGLAEQELNSVFKKIGKSFDLIKTDIEGLFKLKVSEPRKVMAALIKLCKSEPSFFNVTYHYTPVDYWCKTDVAGIQKIIKECINPGIKQNDKWRMGLNKRHFDKYHSTELVIKLTEVINRPNVDLSNPEKIVQVEILGNETGLALLTPEELLNVPKLKGK